MHHSLYSLSVLALALAAAQAQAVHVSPNGSGQVLLFPYYTVQSGQSTLLTLSNSSERAKIVQVNFREGYNGRRVLGFDLVLGPRDSWSGTVFSRRDADAAALTSSDSSCTLPAFAAGSAGPALQVPFVDSDYSGANVDGGPVDISRTREGYFEVVERAELGGSLAAAAAAGDCAPFRPLPADATNPELRAPGGGLRGHFAIVDVAQGTLLGGNATAIDGFASKPLYLQGSTRIDNVDTLSLIDNGTADVVAQVDAGGRLIAASYPPNRRLEALSAVLMTDTLRSDFSAEASIGSSTAWVVSAPTKRFHTDLARRLSSLRPYLGYFNEAEQWATCSPYQASFHDREGNALPLLPLVGFPEPPPRQRRERSFCFATDVLSIGPSSDSPVGRSQLQTQLSDTNPPAQSGIVELKLGFNSFGTARVGLDGSANAPALVGLPLIGFQAVKYINGNVTPGVLSNYTLARPLQASSSCRGSTFQPAACP